MTRTSRGSSLIEAVAAVALAGMVSAGWANALAGQVRSIAAIRERSDALTLARNVLVAATAAPCAPAPDCPRGTDCRISRAPLRSQTVSLERIAVSVRPSGGLDEDATSVRLATIAYAGGVCP